MLLLLYFVLPTRCDSDTTHTLKNTVFTRDALQEFVQDPQQPAHLVNDNNEYLHYSDDWWIVDYEYDNNPDNVPPFAFVYYRGSNDAWYVFVVVIVLLKRG